MFLPWVPEPLQIATYTNSFDPYSVLLEETSQKSSDEKLYPHTPFHPGAGFEGAVLSGFTG